MTSVAQPPARPIVAAGPLNVSFTTVEKQEVMPGSFADFSVKFDVDLRDGTPPAVTPTQVKVKATFEGAPMVDIDKALAVTPEERKAAAAVRDAWSGSSMIKRATPADDNAVDAGFSKVVWTNPDGVKFQAVEKNDAPDLPEDAALTAAIENYMTVSGLEKAIDPNS